jgi:hypothetical protein
MKHSLLSLLLPALFLTASGAAQGQDDPPSRVARIAYVNGPVSFEPASVDQWADASPNYPMTTGDSLYSDAGGRAVLRIGQNSIRLNSLTNFQFVNLADDVVQASINSGGLGLHVRHLFDGESWEIDTPNGAVTVLRGGDYRIDTDPDGDFTTVTVRSGDVEVTANNQSFPVHAGQTAYFDDSGNPPDISGVGPQDDFDAFFVARNRVEDVPAPQYVSPEMVGYEDLAANGEWANTPEGAVWTPRVAAGWTPYHDGHWAWVAPWGWTWVDDAPWGFAPFHYGRWAMVNNRWGWYPGAVAPRPYYAPALVAFVGGGGFGVGISVGGGGGGLVGWFPLGPKEVYYPTYKVSPTYVRQVNVTNTRITTINVTNVNVTNITYVNRTAVVAVPQNSFVSAQPVRAAAVRMTSAQIQQGQVIGAAPKVAPQPQSVIGAAGAHRAAAPPAAVASRAVVAKRTPPPAPVPFAAQQKALEAHPGTPPAKTELTTLRAQAPAPARVQVKPIDTKQVHAITPVVKTTAAPPLAQRAAQAKAAPKPVDAAAKTPAAAEPAKPAAAVAPKAAAVEAARPAAAPKGPVAEPVRPAPVVAPKGPVAEPAKPAPVVAPKAPPVVEQARPAARPVPAPEAKPKTESPAPKAAEPKAAEPKTVEAARPVAAPKAAEPKAAEPKAVEAAKPVAAPKAAEPKAAEPKAAAPKAAEPKAAPKTTKEEKKAAEEKKKE